MPNENGLRVNIKNTVDTKKIRDLLDEANVDILVGFKGGQQHNMNAHRKNRKEEFRDLEGNTPDNIKPIDVDKLAMMLHFGTADIPARPFLTDAIRQNSAKLKKMIQKQVTKLAEGKKANWTEVGTAAVGAVVEFVSSDYYKTRVPNSKKTIEHKGSDMPLIDTHEMVNSVTFDIRKVK